MTRRDPNFYLMHMLDHARYVVRATAGRTRADLDTDPLLRGAIERWLSVIGEAASRLPEEVRSQQKDVEWSKIIGMRHHLVHGYDTVNLDIVWDVVRNRVPPLIERLEGALRERGIDPNTLLSGDDPQYAWDAEG